MNITWPIGVVLAMGAVGLAACVSTDEPISSAAPLKIYLYSDGSCKVQRNRLPCAEVPTYMRDVLNLSNTAKYSIIAKGNPSLEVTMTLFDALGRAGFGRKFGVMDISGMEK
jgi:hypothetical protein